MSLYRWDSEALKRYSQGDIAAYGVDADAARIVIRQNAEAWWRKEHEWRTFSDDDCAEEIAEFFGLLDGDLQQPPTESEALFLWGSE